jgi:hypothetical protein
MRRLEITGSQMLSPSLDAVELGSREDFARRYGAFLGFLQRTGRLDHNQAAAAQVTLPNVDAYIEELNGRVRSVTVYNCIYKLRRAAELLAPGADYSWLAEIERDLALVMVPRSKFARLVFTPRLVYAGLTLIAEAQQFAKTNSIALYAFAMVLWSHSLDIVQSSLRILRL